MSNDQEIEFQNIDHLGIIAGIIDAIGLVDRVSASQSLLTNGFYESVELGKAAAKTESIY